MYVCVCMCENVCMCVCVYVCLCMYVCMYVCMYTCIHWGVKWQQMFYCNVLCEGWSFIGGTNACICRAMFLLKQSLIRGQSLIVVLSHCSFHSLLVLLTIFYNDINTDPKANTLNRVMHTRYNQSSRNIFHKETCDSHTSCIEYFRKIPFSWGSFHNFQLWTIT